MRCEVVAVGTELLLGQIMDTNSSWIGEQLALAGIDSHFQTKVGDNMARIIEAFQLALSRSDAVISCGGLGPTHDDITRDAIARLMGVPLQHDPVIAERIRAMFASRGRVMPENNLRQADVPMGARIIEQMPGTAPGLLCPVANKVIYAVPGVPSEMRAMVAGTIIPDLKRRSGSTDVIRSRTLRTWGESESGLAERLAGCIEALDARGNPTLAFLASGIEGIKVRLTAKAASDAAALALIETEEAAVRAVVGDLVFGIDDETMEIAVLRRLTRQGLTLSCMETVTGGLLAARLSAAPGSDGIFRGGTVLGSEPANPAGLEDGGVPSEGAAIAMARAARRTFHSDAGVAAVLDTASGGGERSASTVYLGVAVGERTASQTVKLPGDRERTRQFAVINLLDLLRRQLPA